MSVSTRLGMVRITDDPGLTLVEAALLELLGCSPTNDENCKEEMEGNQGR